MKPVLLLILDGWGIAPRNKGNAIELAKKPNFDKLWDKYPHTELKAHGKFVGLRNNKIVGNSEAGHINIGAGRTIKDDAVIVSEEIENKKFFKNLAFIEIIRHVQKNNSDLHLMGLVSDGESPHALLDHLYALIDLASDNNIKNVYLHLFTDGRDSPQFASLRIVHDVLKKIKGKAILVSLVGRYFAMDRGKNWQRTKRAYDLLTSDKGIVFEDYKDAILHAYNQKITDEFLEPTIISQNKRQSHESRIKDNDGVIFFNARSDRARQLTKCFVQDDFNQRNPGAFKRNKVLKNLQFCALTNFEPDLDHILTAYPSANLDSTIPLILKDYRQLYIAEAEKYAHVTYFINGGSDVPVNGEDRVRIPSLKIKGYNMKPEMSIYKVTNYVKRALLSNKYDFITVNFANPDMVGHTGDLKACIKAIEHVDICLKEVTNLILKQKGAIIITADHGNAEKMINLETNEVYTSHTTNPVPFILVDNERKGVKLEKGIITNIAPTIYDIMGIEKLPKIINNSLIKTK